MTVPVELAVGEPAARDRSKQDRLRPGLDGGGNEQAEILLISPERRCVPFRIALFRVVVTKLDENVVAGFEIGLDIIPEAPVDKTLGAPAVLGIVDHVYSLKEIGEHHSPAPLGIAFREVFVGHRGVAHQMDRERTEKRDGSCRRSYEGESSHCLISSLTLLNSMFSAKWISLPLSAWK